MKSNGACCAVCKYCEYENGDLMCVNDMSDMFADYVDNECCCDEFEGKDD